MAEAARMKILLVEDSAIDRRKVETCLKEWGLDYVVVTSGTEAAKLLEQPDPPNMALLDWVLPGMDGIQLCRKIRQLSVHGSYIYTVMLTSKNRKQDLLTAMGAGADDYLAKPVNPSELRARILVAKRILDLQQSLKFAATHDVLTSLANRSEFWQHWRENFRAAAARAGRLSSFCLISITSNKSTIPWVTVPAMLY
jgi:PleD family two-component response regulator